MGWPSLVGSLATAVANNAHFPACTGRPIVSHGCPGLFSRSSNGSGASIITEGLPFLVTMKTWPFATSWAIRLRRLRAWLMDMTVITVLLLGCRVHRAQGRAYSPTCLLSACQVRHTARKSSVIAPLPRLRHLRSNHRHLHRRNAARQT